MANKKISELDQTLNLSDQADFPLSQDNGGEPTTFRAKLTQIATKIAEAITFSNLKTGNKQLVSAVNQTISNLADDFNTTAGSTYSKDDCVLYNGVLYQCINNSGTTSGTFIDADWTAIKAVDVGSGGGGGGGAGGHTIVDDAGTSLTQRTNLQFKGAYSEDNSTDDTTEVNVVREMTKAEFDELTEAEKTGFINITDITGGNDDRFQPVIYSEEEREIGVWVDGKPLYEKTFLITQGVSMPQYQWVDTGVDLPNAEQIIWSHLAAGVSEISGIADIKTAEDYSIYVMNMRNVTVTLYKFTVRYTKTTDTAGSGQWTPQGVPAHHYSEDEQIVGTWIDGSTVYEKVFDLGSDISVPNTELLETSIDATNINKLIQVTGMYSSGATIYPLMANIGNNKIRLQSDRNGSGAGASVRYVILRYTKSST